MIYAEITRSTSTTNELEGRRGPFGCMPCGSSWLSSERVSASPSRPRWDSSAPRFARLRRLDAAAGSRPSPMIRLKPLRYLLFLSVFALARVLSPTAYIDRAGLLRSGRIWTLGWISSFDTDSGRPANGLDPCPKRVTGWVEAHARKKQEVDLIVKLRVDSKFPTIIKYQLHLSITLSHKNLYLWM